jgi:hypothetical protein
LSGCAAQIIDASQSACQSFGFAPGTDAYTQCVHQEVNMRDDAVNHAFLKARGGSQGPQKPPSRAADGVAPILKGSYVSGSNRVCLYNQLGNEVAITIKEAAVCPKMLQ